MRPSQATVRSVIGALVGRWTARQRHQDRGARGRTRGAPPDKWRLAAGLAAVALLALSGNAFAVYVDQTFETTASGNAAVEAAYPQYTYTFAQDEVMTVGVNRELQVVLNTRDTSSANIRAGNIVLVPGKPSTVSLDITGNGGSSGNWGLGLRLVDTVTAEAINIQVLLGWPSANGIQVSGTHVSYVSNLPSPGLGSWSFSTSVLNHLVLRSDGFGHFGLSITNGANASQVFNAAFDDSFMTQFTSALLIPLGPVTPAPVTLYYDNWIIDQVPEPSTALLFGLGGAILFWVRRRRTLTTAAATVGVSVAVLVGLSGSAFATTVLNEQFNTDRADTPTTAATYSQYDYSSLAGASLQVTDGQLNMTLPAQPTSTYEQSVVFSSYLVFGHGGTVSADMTGINGQSLNSDVGFELRNGTHYMDVFFFPYPSHIYFYAVGNDGASYTNFGDFFPTPGVLEYLSVQGNGLGNFTATLTDGNAPHDSVSFGFTDTYLASFQAGLYAQNHVDASQSIGPITGIYDNWVIDQTVPEPSTTLLFGFGGAILAWRRRR